MTGSQSSSSNIAHPTPWPANTGSANPLDTYHHHHHHSSGSVRQPSVVCVWCMCMCMCHVWCVYVVVLSDAWQLAMIQIEGIHHLTPLVVGDEELVLQY